jgi:peptidoglycan pentaglycine glycine transferase (the first glycine)
MNLAEVTDRVQWDEYVSGHPHGHPLQLWGWGEVKSDNRWTAHRLALLNGDQWVGAAQVLLWPIPRLGRFIAYIPRGPVVNPAQAAPLLEQLAAWSKSHRALYLRVEPAWRQASFGPGWVHARHHLQMFATYTIDLEKSEEELLAAMSRKHRQYIRGSERDGVSVRRETTGDLGPMYQIYQDTAQRAGFGIHPQSYYQQLWQAMGEANYLYYAYFEGRPVAFLWNAAAGVTSYELYGGMDEVAAKTHANYLLKWTAFMDAKAAGYILYDFNGRVTSGVASFKAGFGPDETDWVGTYDYPLNRVGYQLWEHLWPVAKPIGRRLLNAARGRR